MTKKQIRIGIAGYGNIGRGVELAIKQNPDMILKAVFTRRDPEKIKTANTDVKVYRVSDAKKHIAKLDVVILCGGSATDLPEQGPLFASLYNTVDSYDTHAKIPQYFKAVDEAARASKKTSVISTGWDPGLFSLMRVLEDAVLPDGNAYTFWGAGVSQGHSDAIRRVPGVKDARQYTIPVQGAVEKVRSGKNPKMTSRAMHLRDCYVVAEKGANRDEIAKAIMTMPHYFADYETKVTFITEREMAKNHDRMPHGGFVFRSGKTSNKNKHIIEFSLKLDSNPEFTANVLVAYARAVHRLNAEGQTGARTVFDIPPLYLSSRKPEELMAQFL